MFVIFYRSSKEQKHTHNRTIQFDKNYNSNLLKQGLYIHTINIFSLFLTRNYDDKEES